MGLLLALSPLLLAAAAPATACDPIPGWDQMLAKDEVRFIVIGELHGTNEIPALFADAVCLTAQERQVVVAVEQPSIDQAAIDAFMASDGGEEARREFLDARMWNMSMKDGRSSQAYFRLCETLRQMRAAGRIVSVVAFQPSTFTAPPTPAEYEKAMADLIRASGESGATVLALAGAAHAMRGNVPTPEPYPAMAAYLPAEATITLNVKGEAGESWVCSEPNTCGVKSWPGTSNGHTEGVKLDSADPNYSGAIYLAKPLTASPPQAVTVAQGD